MSTRQRMLGWLIIVTLLWVITSPVLSQQLNENTAFDAKVKFFFENHRHQWRDMNVPQVDGKILYDLIIKHQYKKALEIGTSTGHSAIWIAWALSKTGGKLITIEINERRYKEAVSNFKEAGLSEYIDARLADAHDLVPKLKGSFDFVFSDADKNWYKKYFLAVSPKLKVGGCFTAHNISSHRRSRRSHRGGGTQEFIEYVKSLPNYETTIDNSGAGVSISFKKSERNSSYQDERTSQKAFSREIK